MAADSHEYFWGCELRKDKLETTWSFEEEEEEDDTEYLIHTLFLKHAVLGPAAVKGERNIVEIETKNFDKNTVKQSLLSLTLGQQDMFMLDISFSQGTPVTFRLVEGSGPVCLAGQQLVEYPDDANESQDDSMLSEEDDLEEEEEEEDISKEEGSLKKMPAKRKASSQISGKVKKGKRDSSPDEEEEEEEEDEEMESEEMEEEDEDDDGKSEKKKPKGKKVKRESDASQAGKKLKSAKASPKRVAKAPGKSKKAVKK